MSAALLWTGVGYLSGGILFSQWLPLLVYHIDVIAQSPDHNPGTANAMQLTNVAFGLFCLALELLKGALPVYFAARTVDPRSFLFCPVLVAPVLGHAFSPYLRLHGGKAIAVSFGVLLGFSPYSRMVFSLAAPLVFFSTVLRISPNAWRVCVSYLCFCALCLLIGSPTAVVEAGLISCIVIAKHVRDCAHCAPSISFLRWKYPMRKQ